MKYGFIAGWLCFALCFHYLDVPTDINFNNLGSDYNNMDVGNTIPGQVTGLQAGALFFSTGETYSTSRPGLSSNVNSQMTNQQITHFTALGNPENYMSIKILEARLDNVELETGDEIGIFDGGVCVGAIIIPQSLGTTNDDVFVTAKAFAAESGSFEGFIAGHDITYRLWDASSKIEIFNVLPFCFNDQFVQISCIPFEAGGNVSIVLSGRSEFTLVIDLQSGWNIFSTNALPSKNDMKEVVQYLIENKYLVKVQDETGNSLEDYGLFGGWLNNIGNIKFTRGYKIKVTDGCQLRITGVATALPLKIPLSAGWNIAGFPGQEQAQALTVVQQLIDRKTLVKVQDENGNAIEDWGIFGGWQNGIGNFRPGEGYKIKVSANDTLTIY